MTPSNAEPMVFEAKHGHLSFQDMMLLISGAPMSIHQGSGSEVAR